MCRFIRGKIEGDIDQSTDSIEQLTGMLKSGRSRSRRASRRMASLSVGPLQTMVPIAWLKIPDGMWGMSVQWTLTMKRMKSRMKIKEHSLPAKQHTHQETSTLHPRGRLVSFANRVPAKQQTSRDISYAPLGSAGPSFMHPWARLVRQFCTLGVGWSSLSTFRPIGMLEQHIASPWCRQEHSLPTKQHTP